MKKMLVLFVSILAGCLLVSCKNNDNIQYSKGLEFTLSEDGTYYIVTGIGTCTDSDIVVPQKYKSLPVKAIAPLAFTDAFDDDLFRRWNSFVFDMMSGECKEIPEDFCAIDSITIFGNITNIDQSLFRYTFPKQINVMDSEHYSSVDGVLYSADKKTLIYYPSRKEGENFIIPDFTEKINGYAFGFSSKLKNVIIPDHITLIDEASFACFTSLENVEISKSVISIGNHAFSFCPSIKSVSIPNNVQSIANNAFECCESLERIQIPDSVVSIGEFAFYDCTSLKSVVLEGATNIGNRAFDGCYRLAEIINKSTLNIVAGSEDYGNIAYYAIEVHNGESKVIKADDYSFYTFNGVNYLLDYSGDDIQLILPQSYEGEKYHINARAFQSDSLTSVVIPNNVVTIGDAAFFCCNALTSVVIGDGVVSIGNNMFYGCTSLTSVVIPKSVTSIGNAMFGNCSQIENVYYTGTEAEWSTIKFGDYNGDLTRCTIHYNYTTK